MIIILLKILIPSTLFLVTPPHSLTRRRFGLCRLGAIPFVDTPPVLPSLSRRHIPSSTIRQLSHRLFCFCRRAAIPSSTRHQFGLFHHAATSLPCHAVGFAIVVAPPLFSLSRSHTLPRHDASSAFVVAPPCPSSSRRQFCLCRCAAMPFLVTPSVLPSSMRHNTLPQHAVSSAFVLAPQYPSSRRFCLRCGAVTLFLITLPHPSSPRLPHKVLTEQSRTANS